MSAFVFTVPTTPAVAKTKAISRRESIFGRDISYDVRTAVTPNMDVTPAGDWALIEGRECLRQALIRRLITDPGEWTTNPNYGVGAVSFVKARDTRGNRDELERRIRSQFLADPRVKSVESVQVTRGNQQIKFSIRVIPTGEFDSSRPLVITHEVA